MYMTSGKHVRLTGMLVDFFALNDHIGAMTTVARIMNSGQLVEEYCRTYGKQGLYKSFRSIESSHSLKIYIRNIPKKRKKEDYGCGLYQTGNT